MSILSALSLSSAAGLNAYIPMLILGLLARYTDFVELPAGWAWLADGWLLIVVGVLLAIEIVADKIPALDSVNDIIQTVIRPASGGIVFASGLGGTSERISSSQTFTSGGQWVAVLIGVVVALAMHFLKSSARPALNTATVGTATPVVSTGEDLTSVALSLLGVVLPILAIILLVAIVFPAIWIAYRLARRRREKLALDTGTESTAR